MLGIGNRESRGMAPQFVACTLISALLSAGCQQERQPQQKEVVLAVAPDAATVSTPSDFAAKAIEAAGGLSAWTRTKEVRLASVVTLYQPDGSRYLSEQTYDIYPWSNSIRVSAGEPEGQVLWQVSNGKFTAVQGGARIDELPRELSSHDLAEAVLSITTAPARLLDNSAEFTSKGAAVKVLGQWHQPIERTPKVGLLPGTHVSPAIFYQNRDNSLMDMIQFSSTATGKTLTVRGYDYDQIEKGGPLLPARIEVFTTDNQANAQDRLVTIDSPMPEPAE